MRSLITSTIGFTTRACRMGDAWSATMMITTSGTSTGGAGCGGEMD